MPDTDWLSFFIDEGISVIPLKKNTKKPAIKWKKYTEDRLAKDKIEDILAREDSQNIGIICGEISGNLVVLDIDNAELFEKLSLGEVAAKTLSIRTSKGYHIYIKFSDSDREAIEKWIGEKGVKTLYYPPRKKGKIDESHEEIRFQWDSHYVVGPGGTHPSGTKYEALPTSPKVIREAKGVGLLEEIERRWKSYRKIKKKGEKILEEPLLEFIKRYATPKNVVDSGDYLQMWSPFHEGTSPSAFTIYKSDNHWYDFSEEIGGRHVEFLMRVKNISREEANSELGIEKKGGKQGAEGNYATTVRLDDGRYAEELLREDVETFVLYNPTDDSWEYVAEVENGGEKIYPLPLFPNQRSSITLADGVEEYGTLKELRKEMLEFGLDEFDPVDNRELFELTIQLELISWIASERMRELSERFIPLIAIRGPSETGKKRFLTIARWLTYRPLYALKTTKVPTLFRALAPWGGTLILDEADLADSSENNEFVEFMNSRADGVPIPRYNSGDKTVEFFHSFGTSIVAERSSSTDDGYESRKVIFPSDATIYPEKYSLIPPKEWTERGKVLQRKLLLFRLRHLTGDVPTNLIIEGVKGFRVRESLLLLQALSGEDSDIVKDIASIAKKLEKRIITERSGSMEGLILNIVYNSIEDIDTYLEPHEKALEIMMIQHHGNKEDTTYPLTLKYISKGLGEVISAAEVARRWRGLGQDTTPRGRREGRRYSGIIQISNPTRFLKEVGKYVVDIDYDELREKMGTQKGIDEWNEHV
jgi:hypothetical protein